MTGQAPKKYAQTNSNQYQGKSMKEVADRIENPEGAI